MNVYELKDRTDSNISRSLIPAHQNPYEQAKPTAEGNPYDLPSDYTPNNYTLPVERDIRTSYAADLNPLRAQSSSLHCRSLFATLLLLGGEIAGPVIYITQPDTLSLGGLVGICVGSYILYLMVACICNDLLQYLSHISHGINFEDKYSEVRALIGRFHLTATCYHYERRQHFREVTDSNGNRRMEAYTTTEKVITHTATEYITPARTLDASGQADRIRANKNIVFIHFLVSYRFNDDASRIKFDYLYERFKQMNRRDVHQDYSFDYEVPGLVEKQAFYVGLLTCKYASWFYFFGVFGLVWPYSLWMERKVDRFNIAISKVLSL